MNKELVGKDANTGTALFVQESERVFKLAEFLASSDIIPKHFQGKKANCFIALEMSQRLGINFFELVNGLYVVHGSPGFSGAFIISLINRSDLFKTDLNFKIEGEKENLKVVAWAYKKSGQLCKAEVGMDMAKAEGWVKNPKYKTMPEQMLIYRSAAFFCRRYCPQILMGAKTMDEIEDIRFSSQKEPETIQMKKASSKDDLNDLHQSLENIMKESLDAGIHPNAIDMIYKRVNIDDSDNIRAAIKFLTDMLEDYKSKKE